MTLAEHHAQLKAEGLYDALVEKKRLQKEERQKRVAVWRRAEVPLIEALRFVGWEVGSAWDLVNTSEPYPEALPVLLEHLQRPYPDRVREGIARSLAVRDAKFAWDVLKKLYQEEVGPDTKHGLAVALAATADRAVLDEVIALVRDREHGSSRGLLLKVLSRSRDPRALQTLKELAEDPELYKEIAFILKRKEQTKRRKKAKGARQGPRLVH